MLGEKQNDAINGTAETMPTWPPTPEPFRCFPGNRMAGPLTRPRKGDIFFRAFPATASKNAPQNNEESPACPSRALDNPSSTSLYAIADSFSQNIDLP